MAERAGRASNRKAKRQKVRIGAENTAWDDTYQDGFFQILLMIVPREWKQKSMIMIMSRIMSRRAETVSVLGKRCRVGK